MNEVWKEMIYQGKNYGFKFEISNQGRLRNKKNGHIYKTTVNKYEQVCVSIYGKKKSIRIHRAVAETFISDPNNYPVINHIDGNKLNNKSSNLEWCTHSKNTKHAYDTGLKPLEKISGVNNYQSKLSEENIRYIRENYKPRDRHFGARALGRRFNIHHSCIEKIIHNESYKDIL